MTALFQPLWSAYESFCKENQLSNLYYRDNISDIVWRKPSKILLGILFVAWAILLVAARPKPSVRTHENRLPPIDLLEHLRAEKINLSASGSSLVLGGKSLLWVDSKTKLIRTDFQPRNGETLRFLAVSLDGNSVAMERGKNASPRHYLEFWRAKHSGATRLWRKPIRSHEACAAVILASRVRVWTAPHIEDWSFAGRLICRRRIGCNSAWDDDAFSPDGKYLWAARSFYRVADCKRQWTLWEEQFVNYSRFSPSSRWLYITAIDTLNEQNIFLFDTRTNIDHGGNFFFNPVAGIFAPDDSLANGLTKSQFFTPANSLSSFKCPDPFRGMKDEIAKDVQFSWDGKIMAAVSHSGRVAIENLTSQKR